MVDRTDGQLVARCLQGKTEAFGVLVDRYRHMVYGLGYHLTGDFESARDLAQESFIEAYLKLGQLQDPERFPGWLRKITVNVHRMKRRRPGVVTVRLEDEVSAAAQPRPSEIGLVVRDALISLKESDRLALTLHYIDGYSCAEIGGFLGVSSDTVKMRLSRARKHLKKEMIPMVEDGIKRQPLPDDFTPKTIAEALHRGHEALSEDDHEAALSAFGEATALSPESAEAHAGLGMAWALRGYRVSDPTARAKARMEFEEALKHDPRNEAALIGVSDLDTDKRAAYGRAVAILPQSAELRYRLAWAVHETGDTKQAVQIMSTMLGEDISSGIRVRIHNNLGSFYHDLLGDPEQGRAHLKLAAEVASDAGMVPMGFFHWRVYAWACLRDHQWQEALTAASRILDAAPTDFERRNLHVLLAAAKANLHRREESMQHLRAAAAPGPDPPNADRWPFRTPASADPLDWVRGNRVEYFLPVADDPSFVRTIGVRHHGNA